MADIIINGPEGQSTINNIPAWATAAGQVSVENVLKGMAKETTKTRTILEILARGGKLDDKNQKAVKKEIETLQKTFKDIDKKQTRRDKGSTQTIDKGLKHLQDLQSDGISQLNKLNKNMTENDKNLDKILNNLNNSSTGLMSMAGMGSKAGFALGFAFDALKATAGVLGSAILTAANYIKNEFLDVFKFYNQALSAGTGGIVGLTHPVENVARAANLAGMSLEEFGEFARSNSKIMRTLTAKGFGDLYSKSLIASGGLLELGFTAEDALGSMMAELEYRRRFGMVIQNQGNNLQSSFTESVRMIRRFAQAAGMSEQELRDGAEVQEDYVDQMRATGIKLGANGEAIADSTRIISAELKAAGLEDLTNPLFEAISKGSAGLSAETMNLITAFPGLYESVERLANDFQTTGQLPKRAGRELALLLRNLSADELAYSSSLFTAGVDGAAGIQNLAKNIAKLSGEQLAKFDEALDTSRFSMLSTFNKLGFIVNQGTATIGDFGKTVLMTALGFDKMSDNTYDFNDSVVSLSNGITELVGNVFGRETGIYKAFENFTEYMNVMFGGQQGDSKEVFEKKLEEARTAFVDNISDFAISIGNDLNKELANNTLAKTIGRFFGDLMDDMAISINKATKGMLFSDKVGEIYARQLISGKISAGQYNQQAGRYTEGFFGSEANVLTNQMITSKVRGAYETTGIGQNLSRRAGRDTSTMFKDITSGSDEILATFGKDYPGLIDAITGSLYDIDTDFEDDLFRLFDFDNKKGRTVMKSDLSEKDKARAERMQEMMQQRYEQAVSINEQAYNSYAAFLENADANNIKINGAKYLEKLGKGLSLDVIMDDIVIDGASIGERSNSAADRYRIEQFARSSQNISAMQGFNPGQFIMGNELNALIQETIGSSPLSKVVGGEDGIDGAYVFNSVGKNRSKYFSKDSNALADMEVLNKALVDKIVDGLTLGETTSLSTMLETMERRYPNLNAADKEYINQTKELVEKVSDLTNELSKYVKQDGADASSGG
jgi:hypothetical protein